MYDNLIIYFDKPVENKLLSHPCDLNKGENGNLYLPALKLPGLH